VPAATVFVAPALVLLLALALLVFLALSTVELAPTVPAAPAGAAGLAVIATPPIPIDSTTVRVRFVLPAAAISPIASRRLPIAVTVVGTSSIVLAGAAAL
jgi:hypothetical protein